MASTRRYSTAPTGHGGRIAVAVIATASGLTALFAYHTSPGQGLDEAQALPPSTAVADGTDLAAQPLAGAQAAGDGQASGGGQAADGGQGGGGQAGDGAQASGGTRPSASASRASQAAKVYLGRPATTQWGTVQVKITVRDGKIIKASAPVSPNETPTSLTINKRALPILNAETVKAGSAQIDAVSGATVTSGGYVESLQSAVDQAHL